MGRKPKEKLTQFQREIVYADITFDNIPDKLNHFNELNEDGTHTNIEHISCIVTKTIFYRKLNEIKKKTELYHKARKELSGFRKLMIIYELKKLDDNTTQLESLPIDLPNLGKIVKNCNIKMKLVMELNSYDI